MPIGSSAVVIATSTDSPDPRQRPFRPGHRSLSGRLAKTTSGNLAMPSRFPVAFRPPAFASRVILRPLGSSTFLTVGPPTTTNAASDPHRDCHVPHMQDATGLGALSTPG